MEKIKTLAITLLMLSGTFFSYGCTAAQRKELMDEALANAKAYAQEHGKEILAKAAAKAEEIAAAKIREMENKKLGELDAALSNLAVVTKDPDTGIESRSVKTWKDFDEDKNNSLSEGELVKAGTWITAETARRVASGQMSKDAAKNTGTAAGTALAALLALALAKRGVAAVAKKANPTPPAGGGGATT